MNGVTFKSKTVAVLASVIGLTMGAGTALAGDKHWQGSRHDNRHSYDYDRIEYARVIDVDPIVRRVRVSNPVRECWNEERPVYGGSRTVTRSTIVGGLIGAAAGHHISEVHGVRDPAVIVGGSLIGAAIGNSIGHNRAERRGEYREVGYDTVQRCQVNYRDEWAEQIEGYRVTYVYQGRRFVASMPYDPGRRVRVNDEVYPRHDRRGR